jgi:ABC-type transport system substrate-binding protein
VQISHIWANHKLRFLAMFVSAMFLLVLACGGGDGDDEDVSSAPTATQSAAQPAPTATKSAAQPAPTASQSDSGGPSGSIVAALEDVGVPIGTPGLCVPGCANEKYFFSAFDTLVHWSSDDKAVGGVAESWELAPDLSKFTWNIRKGIQFHKDWGELTAADVAFSTNQVNSNTNPDSVHDVAGDMSCCYGETTVVDRYTAETIITNYDSRAPGWLFSNLRDAYGISSKAVFDEFGSDGMRDVFVGTGPYQILEWLDGDRLELEAVEHYRKTPDVQSVLVLEVPEEASRIAMFKSGQADITHVSLPNVSVLEGEGGIKRLLETVITHVAFAPNFLEKINPKNGEPMDNPGFDGSLPWVSDPFAPGCNWDVLLEEVPNEADVCDAMNSARLVRTAMAMVIDQDALIEGLLSNLGFRACNWAISTKDPVHNDDWCIPYDPEGARQLMKEAGYPDGFEGVGIWVGNEPKEIHQAVSSMWAEELGIITEFHTGPFSVWQPVFVDRSLQHLVFDGEQGGMPAHYAKGREAQAWFEGGIMWSGGIPFYQRIYGEMLGEPDIDKRNALAVKFANHEKFWTWEIGVWEQPIYTVYAGDKLTWDLTSHSIHTQVSNYVFPLEDLTLK